MKSRMLVVVGVVVLLNVTASRVMAQAKTKAQADEVKAALYDAQKAAQKVFGPMPKPWGSYDEGQKVLWASYNAFIVIYTEQQKLDIEFYLSEAQAFLDTAKGWVDDSYDALANGDAATTDGYKAYYKGDYTAAWTSWMAALSY